MHAPFQNEKRESWGTCSGQMALKHRSELGAVAPSQASESGRAAKQVFGLLRPIVFVPLALTPCAPASVPVSSS
jgi:hypothetical protein